MVTRPVLRAKADGMNTQGDPSRTRSIPMGALSPRDTQVLDGILDGKALRAIGVQMGMRRAAVVMARRRIYRTIGAHGRADVVRYAATVGRRAPPTPGLRRTRRADPRGERARPGRTAQEVAAAIGVSVKMLELMLAGLRRYAKVSSTTGLWLRVVVEQCAGLI